MSGSAPTETVIIPLLAEEASVERRTVLGDTVTVRTVTTSNETIVDELLANEHVEVERVAVRRIVETAPPVREEGDTIIVPVLEEVLVTEKRLFLKEEVHIRRIRSSSRHHEIVTLREQEAVVTRTGPTQPEGV